MLIMVIYAVVKYNQAEMNPEGFLLNGWVQTLVKGLYYVLGFSDVNVTFVFHYSHRHIYAFLD